MKITILDGHPNPESFCSGLGQEYRKAAEDAAHEVKTIPVRDLKFDPILHKGYRGRQELEPDLLEAQEKVQWAEHLVVIHPIWWGCMPALLKGFFDRTFISGWAFKYHEKDPFWDRLLEGRSARLIVTSDSPRFYNIFANRDCAVMVTRKSILDFCGFKPIRVTAIGSVRGLSEEKRKDWLARVAELGRKAN